MIKIFIIILETHVDIPNGIKKSCLSEFLIEQKNVKFTLWIYFICKSIA